MSGSVQVVPRGDSTLIVELSELDPERANHQAIAIAAAIEHERLPGILDIVPTFRTVGVHFDLVKTDIESLTSYLLRLAAATQAMSVEPSGGGTLHRIPVRYGGSDGPDLADVARSAGLTETAVVDLHVSRTYRVLMLGFAPGFAYMGTLDEVLQLPRRTVPRTQVPSGSVAIAGPHTGIYPANMPGGWHVLGRTGLKPFDAASPQPFLFSAGDRVQFYAGDTPESIGPG